MKVLGSTCNHLLVGVKKEHIVVIISNLYHFKIMDNAEDVSGFIFLVNKLIYNVD